MQAYKLITASTYFFDKAIPTNPMIPAAARTAPPATAIPASPSEKN
jgi:hypothetical protein